MSDIKQASGAVAHTPNAQGQWHSLHEHLHDVGGKAQEYATKFGAGLLGYYAGLWHDLGKYNPAFQKYLEQCDAASKSGEGEPRERVPHAVYGAKLAAEQCEPLASLIFGHHAGLQSFGHLGNRLHEVSPDVYQQVVANARAENLSLDIDPQASQQVKELCRDEQSYELLLRILFSCLVDADYLDTEEHFNADMAAKRGSQKTVTDLWKDLQQAQDTLLAEATDTSVNRVRAEVYQACLEAASLEPGLFRLAVPTGGGKTRSGLAFALAHAVQYGLDRIIVAVPYTSIIEQTVGVYRDIFGQQAVLEHHSAVKPDESNEEDARARQAQARLAAQNWDAPLIVTTTVQIFESLFANRTSRCRKLHNIVKSVIILDEVQTLPIGLLKPIVSVLKELCRQYQVSVVLCTATQPALEGETRHLEGFAAGSVRDVVPQEMASRHFSTLSRVEYFVPDKPWSWADIAQEVDQHKQALVILNTRKDALSVLDAIATEDTATFHLSTLLCGKHRREVLEQVRDRLKGDQPCILISTQVVEAGVDLDFPVVYRAAGPLDRIVQAAGRCNREGRRPEKGKVVVFRPQEGKMPPGEYRKAFDETMILLKRSDLDWNDPSIFEDYFRRVYQGLNTDAKDVQKYRKVFDFPEVASRFKLIPDDTTPVVVQYDDSAREQIQRIRRYGLKAGAIRALQPYLVSLRNKEFQAHEELRELIAPGVWVWQGNYDRKKGIAVGDMAIVRDPADLIC